MAPNAGSKPLNVVIVGGSIGGLFTGIVLSRLPQVGSITILERYHENQQEDQGAGIRLSDDVVEAITKYVGRQPQDYGFATDHWLQLSVAGDVLMDQPVVAWCTNWRQLFLILLAKFREMSKGVYRHHCTVTDLVDQGSTVKIGFTDETNESQSLEADLVIGADGLSSTTRRLLDPGSERVYAGYTILRGLVKRDDLSPEVLAIQERAGTFCFNKESQMLSYWVPAGDGPITQETQIFNWGWYTTLSEDELTEYMTDKDGRRHTWSLPAGAMKAEIANRIRTRAKTDLPRALAEGVERTKEPFIQVITDMAVPDNVFMDGKVVLIGDALAGQRPHTASSCTQCCFHALVVAAWLEGHINTDQMRKDSLEYSNILIDVGKQLGQYTQSTSLPPLEKAKTFFGVWFPTQTKLSARFKEFVTTVQTKP